MIEQDKICSCFGHKQVDITDALRANVAEAIDSAIKEGVRTFLFGGLSDFDDLVYDIVSEKKKAQPDLNIKRVFCFPLDHDLHKPPHWFEHKEYEALDCPAKSFEYWYTALYYRNCAMIDMSDVVLFYAEQRENSGACKTLAYAHKKHKHIVNFAER